MTIAHSADPGPRRTIDRRLSVAPMMDHTDRHCRYFLRLITRRTLLYTEMITTSAILRGDRQRLLAFDPAEHPLALQLGGSDPAALAACVHFAEEFGYDEINLNLGCPSDRVKEARFGACLMAEPETVARALRAMIDATRLPVTVKTRIGIDRRDSYDELQAFVRRLADAGCRSFAIHARKAWLHGLSPKQNREIPELRHDIVHRLKADNPGLEIVINGGIESLAEARDQLDRVDGAMIGRAAYRDPYLLAEADRIIFDEASPAPSRREIAAALALHAARAAETGTTVHAVTRHILGLFHGMPGGKAWRHHLSEGSHRPGAGPRLILDALAAAEASARRNGPSERLGAQGELCSAA